MTTERTLDKIFGYNFENVFTSIGKNRTIWKVLINKKLLSISIQCNYKINHKPVGIGSYFGLTKTTKIAVEKKKKTEVKTSHSTTRTLQHVTAEIWKTTTLFVTLSSTTILVIISIFAVGKNLFKVSKDS